MGFRTVKNEPERLIMTPTKWINRMNVIGITLKAGRYGTYQDFFKDSANSGYPCLNEVAV
jgi:hypothetical protein